MRLIDAEPLERLLDARAAQYSNDYGSLAGTIAGCLKLLQAQPTISPPPNLPLTLEELREMDGEPVYIQRINNSYIESGWALVNREWCSCKTASGCVAFFERYGEVWLAYRRKPEEGTAWQQ